MVCQRIYDTTNPFVIIKTNDRIDFIATSDYLAGVFNYFADRMRSQPVPGSDAGINQLVNRVRLAGWFKDFTAGCPPMLRGSDQLLWLTALLTLTGQPRFLELFVHIYLWDVRMPPNGQRLLFYFVLWINSPRFWKTVVTSGGGGLQFIDLFIDLFSTCDANTILV